MWFKQGFFCHRLFGNMSDSFELVEGMEELYFGADQVSIPESDDSAGRAQYYVESYVYEPEKPLKQGLFGTKMNALFPNKQILKDPFFQNKPKQLK